MERLGYTGRRSSDDGKEKEFFYDFTCNRNNRHTKRTTPFARAYLQGY